jgi:hypothetical protein
MVLLSFSNRVPIVETGFKVEWAQNEIGYEFTTVTSESYFWSLPPSFTGNKVNSL